MIVAGLAVAMLALIGFGIVSGQLKKTTRGPQPPSVEDQTPVSPAIAADDSTTSEKPTKIEATPEKPAAPSSANPEKPKAVESSIASPPKPSAARTWTDNTGGYKVEAEFHGYASGTVTLKKADGQIVKLPMERLSQDDQEWIRKRGKQ